MVKTQNIIYNKSKEYQHEILKNHPIFSDFKEEASNAC